MKRFALVVAALALTGCTDVPDAMPDASETEAVQVIATPEPTVAPVVDVAKAKADAIAAGRPEAAWDKNCIAWKMPKAEAKGQVWANKRGQEFLDSKDAACPDAITVPYYYIDSFKVGMPGELIVTVEQHMNAILYGSERGRYHELDMFARGVMIGIMKDNPSVKKVIVQLPNGDKFGSSNRPEAEKALVEGAYS